MPALVLEKTKQLTLRDIALAETLGPHDVRIRIHTVGICGSDVHYYQHGAIGPFVVREPMVLAQIAFGSQPPLPERHSLTSVQVRPSPEYPVAQVQVHEPGVLVQTPAGAAAQPPKFVRHSSTSVRSALSGTRSTT